MKNKLGDIIYLPYFINGHRIVIKSSPEGEFEFKKDGDIISAVFAEIIHNAGIFLNVQYILTYDKEKDAWIGNLDAGKYRNPKIITTSLSKKKKLYSKELLKE